MEITPFDLEDASSGFDGIAISDPSSLRNLLTTLRSRSPFLLRFVAKNGFELTVGIGGQTGCAQYCSAQGDPPYLVALTPSPCGAKEKRDCSFLAGGTLTPVDSSRCLDIEVVERLVMHFYETGQRSTEVEWEEV